jgi:hypothetical protein
MLGGASVRKHRLTRATVTLLSSTTGLVLEADSQHSKIRREEHWRIDMRTGKRKHLHPLYPCLFTTPQASILPSPSLDCTNKPQAHISKHNPKATIAPLLLDIDKNPQHRSRSLGRSRHSSLSPPPTRRPESWLQCLDPRLPRRRSRFPYHPPHRSSSRYFSPASHPCDGHNLWSDTFELSRP